MELSQEQESKLREFVEPFKEQVKSVELWGSCVCPWLEKQKDFDVIIYLKNNLELVKVLRNTPTKSLRDLSTLFKLDIHLTSEEDHSRFIKETLSPYESHYSTTILGYEKLTDYDLISDIDNIKEDYLKKAKNFLERHDDPKQLYKIYITLCLFKNKNEA